MFSDRNPQEIPSNLINKKFPDFESNSLFNDEKLILSQELGNKITLVNFFATWCNPCRDEHMYIKKFSEQDQITVIGINYKDDPIEAKNFINELGNPYANVGIDEQGRTGIDWGVYGIPESFIIHNGKGIYKHIGPIHISELDDTILPILKDLK